MRANQSFTPPTPVAQFAVRSKVVVMLLLLILCFMYFPLFTEFLCLSLFRYVLLCIHSNFAIVLKRERELVTLLLLSYRYTVTITVLWLFLTVSCVGQQFFDCGIS